MLADSLRPKGLLAAWCRYNREAMDKGKRMLAGVLLAAEGMVRRRKPVAPLQAKHVLVLEYMLPLGCLVHMTPVYEAIHRSCPEMELTVATRGLGLQVLRHSPFVDRLIETPDPTTDFGAAVRALRKNLRAPAVQADCVLTGASDQRTKIALLGMLASAGWRGGFTVNPALYQRPLTYDASLSLIANNLRLANLIGCETQVTRPKIFFSKNNAEAAAAILREANPQGQPVVVMVTQTSGGQRTGWHTDRFVRVIQDAARRGSAVVYVGTVGDATAIDAIRDAAGGIGVSIAGRTTVNELAAVLALSDFVVSLDTGTMHVARAVRVPMVVLGPSWQKPVEWMPLGVKQVRILRGEDRVGVPPGYQLDEISADAVIAALGELMAAYPPSPDQRGIRLSESLSNLDHLARP
jgi:ADP-heptose:LPS heptosyltransferase